MNLLIHVAGWSLLHFVWQGVVIAAAAAVMLRLVPVASPRGRYAAASIALAAMLAAPGVTAAWLIASSAMALDSRPEAVAPADTMIAVLPGDAPGLVQTDLAVSAGNLPNHALLTAVVAAWLAGVLLCLVRLAGGWWRVRCLHRSSLAMPASRWQQTAERLAAALRLQRSVRIVDSETIDTPTVIGWLRPVVLMPIAALANLTPAQVEAILAHELAHVRRHDYVINLLQTIAETLLFYHPGVWWVSGQIRAEREHCCDEVAVSVSGNAVEYAAALEELEAWRGRHGELTMAATGGHLLERVRRVLRVPTDDQRPSANAVVTTALVLLLIVVSGAVQHLPAARVSEASPGQAAPQPSPAPPAPSSSVPLGWERTETASFEIVYPPALESQVERVGREAEAAYAQLKMDLRHELAFKPRLVLFATRTDMERTLAAGPLPGAVEHIVLTLDTSPARRRGDLVHEISHVFAGDIIPSSGRDDRPAWIYEGLAEHERGEWDASDTEVLKALVRAGTLPPISSVGPGGFPGNRRLNEIVGHAVFDFIVSRAGKDGMRRFLLAVRQAPVGGLASAYSLTFGLTAPEFDRSFDEYLRARFAEQP